MSTGKLILLLFLYMFETVYNKFERNDKKQGRGEGVTSGLRIRTGGRRLWRISRKDLVPPPPQTTAEARSPSEGRSITQLPEGKPTFPTI